MGKFHTLDDIDPDANHQKKRDREYLGFGFYILTFSDGTKKLVNEDETYRQLFYKADRYDEFGQPFFREWKG